MALFNLESTPWICLTNERNLGSVKDNAEKLYMLIQLMEMLLTGWPPPYLKRGRIRAQRRNKPLTRWPPAKSTSRNCISHVAPLLRQYPFNTLWNRTKSLGYTYNVIIPSIGVGNDLPSQCNCQHAAAMLGFLKPSLPVSCSKVARK